jgi:hypothetical protein
VQHVIAGSGQVMRHGLQCHRRMRAGPFPVIIRANDLLIANREAGGLDKRSAEVLIPVLRVAGAFPFPIADMFAPDTAATGGEVSDGRESPDIDDFQENRARQDGPDTVDRL